MFIPNNHERIKTVSELFREEVERHEAKGGTYYDDEAAKLAAEAINICMPELKNLRNERLVIEAEKGISLEGSHFTKHDGLRVEAELARVSIQKAISTIEDSELGSVSLDTYDLFAVFKPKYVEPEPVDIVFSDELLVPFEAVERFEVVG